MREIRIKGTEVISVKDVKNEDIMNHLERYLDNTDCHVLFGKIVVLNKREISAMRMYEEKGGIIAVFDMGSIQVEVGMTVEVISKIARTDKPKIEVRW